MHGAADDCWAAPKKVEGHLKAKTIVLPLALAWALVAWAGGAGAQQDQEADPATLPPQILTSDLPNKLQAQSEAVDVTWVFVDTDTITEVKINGEVQPITPADTVVVNKTIAVDRDQVAVVVEATDEAGNTRTKSYLIYRPGYDPEAARYFVVVEARYEVDDNPSNDLSSPVSLSGVDVQGVVPDDEQEDMRMGLNATVGANWKNWNALGGVSLVRYGKSENARLESDIFYVGGGYTMDNGLFLKYLFADINLGEFDYAQEHTVTPGYQTQAIDEDGTTRHRFAVDLKLRQFARSEQDDITTQRAAWTYFNLDPEGLDSFRSVVSLGSSGEGFDESEYTFVAGNFDWKNRWDSGLLFNIGFGLEYRDYANDEPLSKDTPLGDTRVDTLWRFSAAPGWRFSDSISTLFNYRYVTDISNKAPYVRQVYGLVVRGVF